MRSGAEVLRAPADPMKLGTWKPKTGPGRKRTEAGKGGHGNWRYGGRGGQGRGNGRGAGQRWDQAKEWTEDEWDRWANKSSKEMGLAEEVKHLRECVFALQTMVLRAENFSACLRAEFS